jgi:hypothetical protein
MRATPIIERLQQSVPEFGSRVFGAAALAPLVNSNTLPSETPAAFVIPLGVDAGPAVSTSGAHRQMMSLQWGVMLVVTYAADITGEESLPEVDALCECVRAALAGFQPLDDGVLELKRERLIRIEAGTIFYQLDFAVDEQLRVIS